MQHSYFAVLSIEPRFALPAGQLDTAYQALAARVHPDRFATAEAAERRRALAASADANEAYTPRRRAAPRALHLLQLRGVETGEGRTRVAPAFLMEQMEWREALADARTARDLAALRSLQKSVLKREANLHARLEVELDVEHNNDAAARSAQELLFVEKIVAAINDTWVELED